MACIVAVINNKGGVGKSTVTANLSHAYALANKQKRILTVDLDSQCNLTEMMVATGSISSSFYELLSNESTDIQDLIYPTPYEGVSAIPNVPETASLEPELINRHDHGWTVLRQRLRNYALDNFDITIMDCPPNLGLFVLQAMVCADFVLIPIECSSRFAIKGLNGTLKTIAKVQKELNPDLRFLRLLINKVDRRTGISKSMINRVREWHGDKVFNTVISTNTAIQQAELNLKTVTRHSPKSPGSKQFRQLALELSEILENEGLQLDIQMGEIRANA